MSSNIIKNERLIYTDMFENDSCTEKSFTMANSSWWHMSNLTKHHGIPEELQGREYVV